MLSGEGRVISGRFHLKGGRNDEEITLSGFLEFDERYTSFPKRIVLSGFDDDHRRLLPMVGYIVDVTLVSESIHSSRAFLGRVRDAGRRFDTTPEEIVRIAIIDIVKAEKKSIISSEGEKHYASYTYTADVEEWPARGISGMSFDGTIELRKFRNGIGNLLNSKEIKIEAFPHYFFNTKERTLSRYSLASITAFWSNDEVDWKRYIDCARIVTSFTHVVKLMPVSLSHSNSEGHRTVSWNPSSIERDPKGLRYGPVPPPYQNDFHSRAIRRLFKSAFDLKLLSSIVDRYVESRTDVTLQRSFAHGCEAIEGICGVAGKSNASSQEGNRKRKLMKEVRKVITNSSLSQVDKDLAESRVSQLFATPIWSRVVSTVGALTKNKDDVIREVIGRCNFFRYRNLLVHGREVRLEDEVILQHELMIFVFEWLFLRLCGSPLTPQFTFRLDDLTAPAAPERGVIELWE